MLSMSRFVHTYNFMSGSEESDCYISPSLSSSIMTMVTSKKQFKKRIKKKKQYLDVSKNVRRKKNVFIH
jgi:hypothetical protein